MMWKAKRQRRRAGDEEIIRRFVLWPTKAVYIPKELAQPIEIFWVWFGWVYEKRRWMAELKWKWGSIGSLLYVDVPVTKARWVEGSNRSSIEAEQYFHLCEPRYVR